ncbi:MAG: hypothetical protein DHS20C21_06390 [Gemmatimonadota bacterium]|nr:MAG: hypothetical protein DHS20C21_06390 [Gemmatimonadota bacterium]
MSLIRPVARLCLAVSLCIAVVSGSVQAAEHTVALMPGERAEFSRNSGGFAYTLEVISPLTQSYPSIDFLGPYYYMYLTNTGGQNDTYRLKILNLTQPVWFPQVCLRSICFPDSTDLPFDAAESDTIGVQVVPFDNGVGEWDFVVESLGDPGLTDTFHMVLYAGTAATAVGEPGSPRAGLELKQNAPNPLRDQTSISFALPVADQVSLGVFDVAGRQVADLAGGTLARGKHTVAWDGRGASGRALPNGVYFYRLQTSSGNLTKQLTLVR